MKPITLLFSLLSIQISVSGQTAEEILWNTEHAYRALNNYADEGTFIRTSSNTPYPDTTTYYMALDRTGNVNHWFHKERNGQITGAKYAKSEKDSLGTYTRIRNEGESFTCNMGEAGARMMGSGGGMFFLIGSLFFPDFFSGSPGDSSMIQYYDKASRLDDTTIHGVTCYVIKTRKTNVIPQEVADKQNYQRDSTQGLLDLPPEQRGGPRTVAGPKTFEKKYFIRTSDMILVRVEDFHYKNDTNILQSKSTLELNPRLNVKDFGKYLKE
jgi:hypothetical protein